MNYLIANWKANKTIAETRAWRDEFEEALGDHPLVAKLLETKRLTIIIAPPHPLIDTLRPLTKHTGIALGAQDVSRFSAGSYTGDVTARTLVGLVTHCIVGHSERRKWHHESNDEVRQKIDQLVRENIIPIACVSTLDQAHAFPNDIPFVALEKPEAIGTGNNVDIETVLEFHAKAHLGPDTAFIYGGSVSPMTVSEYVDHPQIRGFLVGGASLAVKSFFEIAAQLT